MGAHTLSHPAFAVFFVFIAIASVAVTPAAASGQVDMQTELVSFYENLCGAELERMRAEWGKMGQNGPAVLFYYESVSQMDAAALQQKVNDNAGLTYGILPRRGGHAVYELTNQWEDCLLRTRSAQLGVTLADLAPPPSQPANPGTAGGDGSDNPDGNPPVDGADPNGSPDPQMAGEGADGSNHLMPQDELNWRQAACIANRNQALEASGQTPQHLPEADASGCIKSGVVNDIGGFINDCGFEVEMVWCLYRPVPGTRGVAFDCERGQYVVQRIAAWQHEPAHIYDAEMIHFGACRIPGATAVASGLFIAGQGMQLRCQPWDDAMTQDPWVSAVLSNDCTPERLEEEYAREHPAPGPGVEQPWQDQGTPQPLPDQGLYNAEPGYDAYATQPPAAPAPASDDGQAAVDAAMQLMQIYLQMELQKAGGTGAQGWQGEVSDTDADDSCWSDGDVGVCQ